MGEHNHHIISVVVLQNSVDLLKVEPHPYSEAGVTSIRDGNEVIGVRFEQVTDIKNGQEEEQMLYPAMEAEREVCC
jgi:hypothetical protein